MLYVRFSKKVHSTLPLPFIHVFQTPIFRHQYSSLSKSRVERLNLRVLSDHLLHVPVIISACHSGPSEKEHLIPHSKIILIEFIYIPWSTNTHQSTKKGHSKPTMFHFPVLNYHWHLFQITFGTFMPILLCASSSLIWQSSFLSPIMDFSLLFDFVLSNYKTLLYPQFLYECSFQIHTLTEISPIPLDFFKVRMVIFQYLTHIHQGQELVSSFFSVKISDHY